LTNAASCPGAWCACTLRRDVPLTTSRYETRLNKAKKSLHAVLSLVPSHSTRTPDVICSMTTPERAASIHGGCDRHWSHGRNLGLIFEDAVAQKSLDFPLHSEAALERQEIESEGSEFSLATRLDTTQRKLNKWQAALIYITNQVGVGILGLSSVMQTLGLIPGIICIVGLGMLQLRWHWHYR
jgi:hypothetical protein